MNRAEKRRQQKKAEKAAKNVKPAQSAGDSFEQQALTIQETLDLAVQHHSAGNFPEAEGIYMKILEVQPDQPYALHFLGVVAHQLGQNERAMELITNALSIKPDYAEAHNTLGLVLRQGESLDAAVASYEEALAVKPNLDEALTNLGNALEELGRLDEAVANHEKAIACKPDDDDLYINLGNVLKALGRLEEAILSYQKALSLNPNLYGVCTNLGNAQEGLGRLDEAAESHLGAIAIKPDFAGAHTNLGNVLGKLGRLEESMASHLKAITIEPDLAEGWNNLKFATKAHQFLEAQEGRNFDLNTDSFSKSARATNHFTMYKYFLDSFKPHEADKSYRYAMAALPPKADEGVIVNQTDKKSAKLPWLPNKMVALLYFGRSGTGLLHSLIDGHPEISTLPSIYLRGFFNAGVWDQISADGWQGLCERFADKFSVLFDAMSPKSTPGLPTEESYFLGRKEGMTAVGKDRNESLSLDRDRFCFEALRLIKHFEKIDPKLFFQIVHVAFEKVLRTKTKKQTIFYHIHNPGDFAKLNFLRYVPETRLVMMVREPIQNCESGVRPHFKNNDYDKIVECILILLFAIDQIAFRKQDSVGVRLEDLKARPEATIKGLCTWLGVQENSSLYEMTAQGRIWWGDPSSPDYNKKKAMSPFGDAAIKRPVGTIFSEKDQFVLRTLFYPFSVQFGYRKPKPDQFRKDLKEVRPLIDDMLDFEKAMAERSNIDHASFKRNSAYQLFRAGLVDRWDVLDGLGDYPHMLEPLSIE